MRNCRPSNACSTTSQASWDAWLDQWGWLLLLGVTAIVLLPGMDTLPLIDRDEPRFAHATLEMRDSGQWIIPYFNGEYRFDKPPLTYWWMQLNYWLAGDTDLGSRLHSAVAAWLTALGIAGFGKSLFSARTGFLAAVAFLSCLQVQIHGRLSVADMPMILSVVWIQRALWELLTKPSEKPFGKWFWVLWWAVGVGFLAKGPIVVFVPLLSWLIHRFLLWRKPLRSHQIQPLTGPLFALVVIALWGIPALALTSGTFWQEGIGKHVVERGTAAFNSRLYLPGVYYVLTSLVSLMPWAAFGWLVWQKLRANWDCRTAFLASWFVAPILIFSFYATQLPHYILPGFAAFFLLLFQTENGTIRLSGKTRAENRFFRVSNAVWAAIILVVVSIVCLEPFSDRSQGLKNALVGVALALIGSVTVGLGFRNGASGAVPALAGLAVIGFGWGGASNALRPLLPAIQLKPVFEAAQALPFDEYASRQQGIAADVPGVSRLRWKAIRFTEPSLVYYSRQRWQLYRSAKESGSTLPETLDHSAPWWPQGQSNYGEHKKPAYSSQPPGIVLLHREWRIENWFKSKVGLSETLQPSDAFEEELASLWKPSGYEWISVEGINFARFSWIELKVLKPSSLPSPE